MGEGKNGRNSTDKFMRNGREGFDVMEKKFLFMQIFQDFGHHSVKKSFRGKQG